MADTMTRIVYGVAGEGSGHSSRAREMASFLQRGGHEIRLVSYARGYENLKDDFPVTEIEGLSISTKENRVQAFHTMVDNLKKLPAGSRALSRLRELFHTFQPQVVISDFEPMTAYLAEYYQLPLISLDNQHRLRYVEFDTPWELETERAMTRNLVRLMVPWPSVSLVTALVPGRPTNRRTFVYPPIVRDEVRQQSIAWEEHVLVYATQGFPSLLDLLQQFPRQTFYVYGYDRDDKDRNLHFFRSSRHGFLRHLASARGVIATAGFTLISESLYLGKPYLACPMAGQFEQELNAYQLQQIGAGMAARDLNVDRLGHFLYRLPEFSFPDAPWYRDDSDAIKKKLGALVADGATMAREFKERRDELSQPPAS
ncbi:MAG: hypothetical protein KatS3mg111_4094 [Pirellulaceae bacterium]|nr:MAG: hypothetical protein KatS3mg111_4094 [Pirellulaceae bacterium]